MSNITMEVMSMIRDTYIYHLHMSLVNYSNFSRDLGL